jgi:hypothetical protein
LFPSRLFVGNGLLRLWKDYNSHRSQWQNCDPPGGPRHTRLQSCSLHGLLAALGPDRAALLSG